MVKVPATPEGLPAIQKLISEGISINITLLFSQKVYAQVLEAYPDRPRNLRCGRRRSQQNCQRCKLLRQPYRYRRR